MQAYEKVFDLLHYVFNSEKLVSQYLSLNGKQILIDFILRHSDNKQTILWKSKNIRMVLSVMDKLDEDHGYEDCLSIPFYI